jgi:hypothetical protein
MIKDMDRSGWFGASDTRFVMMKNRHTKSWKEFWEVKLAHLHADPINTIYTHAGTIYEHHILRAIDKDIEFDGQLKYEKYLIRINYDGWKNGTIYEVKTHKAEKPFEISANYWQQCQVEMFVYQKMAEEAGLPKFNKLWLVSYGLFPDEYYLDELEIEIDTSRIMFHPVVYDKGWVKTYYVPRVKELSRALRRGKFPG